MIEVKDAAHGVRILKALVEQGEKQEKEVGPKHLEADLTGEPDTLKYICMKLTMFHALVDGAKEVLADLQSAKIAHKLARVGTSHVMTQGRVGGISGAIIVLARAYAPRMKEAGMGVPE